MAYLQGASYALSLVIRNLIDARHSPLACVHMSQVMVRLSVTQPWPPCEPGMNFGETDTTEGNDSAGVER